jgi:hypothetical protein
MIHGHLSYTQFSTTLTGTTGFFDHKGVGVPW